MKVQQETCMAIRNACGCFKKFPYTSAWQNLEPPLTNAVYGLDNW